MKKLFCALTLFLLLVSCSPSSSENSGISSSPSQSGASTEETPSSSQSPSDGEWASGTSDSDDPVSSPLENPSSDWIQQSGQAAISPWEYQKLLKKGMDVDWSKTKQGRTFYSSQAVLHFRQAGINHVHIRVRDQLDPQLLQSLDQQVSDCLENGIIPIIAYQADDFKNNPTEEELAKVVQWWGILAERYQDVSPLLAFDLLIEATDALNKDSEPLNRLYEAVVTEIRKTNPQRILMISPRLRSNPAYLHELKIPTNHNGFLMAQWHFYAAGPSRSNEKKQWTIGTQEEKQLILDQINAALQWQEATGIPTWVGAWMPGNYNDGNDYSIDEQCVFASFVTKALTDAEIPFAINSDTKFYNREKGEWIAQMEPVRLAIFS